MKFWSQNQFPQIIPKILKLVLSTRIKTYQYEYEPTENGYSSK